MPKTQLIARRVSTKVAEAGIFWMGLFSPVFAQTPTEIVGGANEAKPENAPGDLLTVVKNIVNIVLFIVGFAAVVMLIVGGVRYVVSAGNDDAVAKAKNTILYAIIGLVIAILAYAAVNFIFNALQGETGA